MSYPNEAHASKWHLRFSNIPSFDGDMQLFDNYIRSFTTPDLNLENILSYYMGSVKMHGQPNRNQELYNFSIEFSVDEAYENYFALLTWWYNLRFGKISGADFYNEYTVNDIHAYFLDNQKRKRFKMRLGPVIVTSVSSLTMTSGDSEILTFTATFSCQNIVFEKFKINDNQGH